MATSPALLGGRGASSSCCAGPSSHLGVQAASAASAAIARQQAPKGTGVTRARRRSVVAASAAASPTPRGVGASWPLLRRRPRLPLRARATPPDTATDAVSSRSSSSDDDDSSAAADAPPLPAATTATATSLAASAAALAGVALLLGGGYAFREPIRHFLDFFTEAVDDWGPAGVAAYMAVYAALEVLAVPAIPLTMTAGVIFGPGEGTAVVSVAATAAATVSFLIARYAARERVAAMAAQNRRFAAIDRAISRDGLRFVVLLRLSPLLPLAASNYLYGLTSVDLGSYVLGSWLGMLPGTYAYVTAGHLGKAALVAGEGEGAGGPLAALLGGGEGGGAGGWQLALGLGATVLALGFVGRLAKTAVEDAEKAEEEERQKEEKRARKEQRCEERRAAAAAESEGRR